MSTQQCKNFVDNFENLSPFALTFICETMLCKLEEMYKGPLGKGNRKLNENELKDAFIEAMRTLNIDIEERLIKEAMLQLDTQKIKLFCIPHIKRQEIAA